VSTSSGYLFQYRLTAPAGLKIEDISLLEDDVEHASRWAQDDDGTVTVFLNGAAAGQQKLVLRGRLPISMGKSLPLPQVRLERCQLRSAVIRAVPASRRAVTIRGGRQPIDAEPPAAEVAKSDLGRFVGAFSGNGSQSLR